MVRGGIRDVEGKLYKMTFKDAVDRLWGTDINDKIRELLYNKDYEKALELFEEKTRMADEAIEGYVARTGERPDAAQLNRLAAWIDKHAEHVSDVLVLSRGQRARREKREIPSGNIDFKREDDGNRCIEPKPTDADGGKLSLQYQDVRMPSEQNV